MEITPKFIKEYFDKVVDLDLTTSSRKRHLVEKRWVAYKLIRTLTTATFPKIGDLYGRDHATVIYGVSKFDEYYESVYFQENSELYNRCLKVLRELQSKYGIPDRLKTIKEVRFECQNMINNITNEFNKELLELKSQLDRFEKNPMFNKIGKLSDSQFKDLEVRVDAFFKMNNPCYV